MTVDDTQEIILNRLGPYKASKVGNGWKISIPQEIVELWGLEELIGSESTKQKKDKAVMPNLYVYAEEKSSEIRLLIVKDPLPGDIQHALNKRKK